MPPRLLTSSSHSFHKRNFLLLYNNMPYIRICIAVHSYLTERCLNDGQSRIPGHSQDLTVGTMEDTGLETNQLAVVRDG